MPCNALQKIVLTAYSPLGSPDSLSMMGRDKTVPVLLENKELNSIAKKLGKNAGQVGNDHARLSQLHRSDANVLLQSGSGAMRWAAALLGLIWS